MQIAPLFIYHYNKKCNKTDDSTVVWVSKEKSTIKHLKFGIEGVAADYDPCVMCPQTTHRCGR
jgi:hypothetical protein